MKTLIRLKIEKFEEKGQEYFVATSDQIQGLVAEGNTIEEVIEIASDLAKILIEIDQEKQEKHNQITAIPDSFEYPLIVEV
jgi:predicted RNase H-like HicB family nuclease